MDSSFAVCAWSMYLARVPVNTCGGKYVFILKLPYFARYLHTNKDVNDKQHGKGGTKHLELVAKAGPQQLTMVSTAGQVLLSAAAREEQGQTLSREQKMFTLQVSSQLLAYLF